MSRTRTAHATVLTVLLIALVSACSGGGDDTSDAESSTPPPDAQATVPAGWLETEVDGLRFAYPPEWKVRTDAQGVSLQVGVPFEGQPFPPPQVQVFVEKEQVGTLQVREPLTKAQISQQLGIELPESTPATIAGARAAVQFSYAYTTKAATSTMDTPLEPTDIKQSDVLIDVPGLPKYGLRYSAPVDQYDDEVWSQLLGSIKVGGPSATG